MKQTNNKDASKIKNSSGDISKMGNKEGAKGRIFLLVLIISFIAVLGVCDFFIPSDVRGVLSENGSLGGIIMIKENAHGDGATASLFGLPVKSVAVTETSENSVYLGGDTLGVKFYTGGVIVVGISGEDSAASKAGLAKGDFITKADGEKTDSVEKLASIIAESGGKAIKLTYQRDGGAYKAGMWIRDSTAGIGTVTFVTKDGVFASLGHGISDADTGMLMPLERGTAVKISVDSAVKGKPNVPGELKGSFSTQKVGSLVSNTGMGLYGVMNASEYENRELITLGSKKTVRTGKAQILATVDSEGAKYYDVEILQIAKGSDSGKNFVIKITDDELIEKTGGIVQGMSGSPIIQDGKLIGAVTHVLVNDPRKGYGIFIENMLNTANVLKVHTP